jgi:hypothetical protein
MSPPLPPPEDRQKKRKRPPYLLFVVAAFLLVSHVFIAIDNLSAGWLRAFDLYPPNNAQAIGYDVEKLAELAVIGWAGYRLLGIARLGKRK